MVDVLRDMIWQGRSVSATAAKTDLDRLGWAGGAAAHVLQVNQIRRAGFRAVSSSGASVGDRDDAMAFVSTRARGCRRRK